MALYKNGTITIKSEDIERVLAAKPENTSNARAYFKQTKLKNSTHISAAELKKEYGNVPVIVRGDNGIVPKHGVDATDIVPMPIEIDDKISAVDMDELERATDMGVNQIVDEYLDQHSDMVRETTNALCCQAHRGKIDYMMKSGGETIRYKVDYGDVTEIDLTENLVSLTRGQAIAVLTKMAQQAKKNGVGGPGEFVAGAKVYEKFVDLLTKAELDSQIKDESLNMGSFKVIMDNDSYTDIVSGNKVTKSLCGDYEIVYRALNAGQKLCFLRLDDVVQRSTVPVYSFTVKGDDQRGTKLYTKSKPFPLINTKGIVWAKFAETASFKVKFEAGTNGTIAATVDNEAITSGDEVEAGKTVVLTATPSDNYEVKAWGGKSKDSLVETGTNEMSIEVEGPVQVSVSFKASN